MEQSETKITQKNPKEFVCELCDFITSNKKDFTRHINTIKHHRAQFETNETKKTPKNPKLYECSCGDIFNSRTTLWRHKKKCLDMTIEDLANEEKQQQLIDYLLKENSEFKQLMLEQNKHMIEMSKNAGHHNTNNSHNTTNNSFTPFYISNADF